jgi:hypothetical protein
MRNIKGSEAFGVQSYEACVSQMRFKYIFSSPVLDYVITEFSPQNPLERPLSPIGMPISSLHSASLAESAFIFHLVILTQSAVSTFVFCLSSIQSFLAGSMFPLTVLREV